MNHVATEKQTIDQILAALPLKDQWTKAIFSRLKKVVSIPNDALVLDVGAASGGFLVGCFKHGYRSIGIEPWEEARENAKKLAERLNIPITIINGTVEKLPFAENIFDVVHASSVFEHVVDIEHAFQEIHRVLKFGGVLWFSTASSMCPMQNEIRGFPFFGWYPNSAKQRIMNWAKTHKPHLLGFTETPAIHWFTPMKTRRLLRRYGFRKIYDRWDLRSEEEGGTVYRVALRSVRSNRILKFLADIVVPGCSYAAIK